MKLINGIRVNKQLILSLLCLILLFALCGCSSSVTQQASRVIESSGIETSVPTQQASGGIPSSDIKTFTPIIYEEVTIPSYIAQAGDVLYYAEKKDNYCLYSMDINGENKKKLSNVKNDLFHLSIQIVGDWLYYCNTLWQNDLWCGALYKVNLTTGEEIKITNDPVVNYAVSDEWIYYIAVFTEDWYANIDGQSLYKIKKDGSEQTEITQLDFPMSMQLVGDQLHLSFEEQHQIMNINDESILVKHCDNIQLIIYHGDVYYTNLTDLWLYREKADGTEMLLVDKEILEFCIADKKIYYELEDEEIYCADLDGKNSYIVANGTSPVVLNDFLWYRNAMGEITKVKLK